MYLFWRSGGLAEAVRWRKPFRSGRSAESALWRKPAEAVRPGPFRAGKEEINRKPMFKRYQLKKQILIKSFVLIIFIFSAPVIAGVAGGSPGVAGESAVTAGNLPPAAIAGDPDSLKYKSLDPHYFHLQYLKEDTAWLIDVSMFYEFRKKRIRDAINIPSVKELYSFTDTISKNTALFLYCTDGFRSEQAAGLLNARGFSNLYNLEGGIIVWKKEGFPVEKGRIRKKKTGLFR